MRKVLLYCSIFILLTPHMAFAQYHQWTKLKGGYVMAVSKEAYDKAWGFIDAHDDEAVNKMFILGAIRKTIEGAEVYIEETHVFHGSREVRLKGGVQIYWVSEMAVYQPEEIGSHKNNAQVSTSPKTISKLDGVMIENGKAVIFVSTRGKVSAVNIGDHLCGGEIIQTYSPGEEDGITSDQSIDKYKYRIKIKNGEEERVFKNGDVICGDTNDILQQTSYPEKKHVVNESIPASTAETNTQDKDAPGMDHVRNAEESFKNAQGAEEQGLYRKALFFYQQAVEYAQWSLAYIIEGKREVMKRIVQEGEQKQRSLAAKKDIVPVTTANTLPKLKNVREIMKWVQANIKYNSDIKLHGERDYWQTPEETLTLRAGDCEDYAFLIQALLKNINIESFVISVNGEGISKKLGHALCVFPKNAPTNYFNNQSLYTSSTHVINLINSAYPLWQKMRILDLTTLKSRLILERMGPSITKVDETKNVDVLKTFLGEWYDKF